MLLGEGEEERESGPGAGFVFWIAHRRSLLGSQPHPPEQGRVSACVHQPLSPQVLWQKTRELHGDSSAEMVTGLSDCPELSWRILGAESVLNPPLYHFNPAGFHLSAHRHL